MNRINALVLTGYGLNCDMETAYALEQAGARARRVHINALIDGTVGLDEFQIMAFIGGFSWGDDHGAGVIQAVRMRTSIGDKLLAFIAQGKLVIGICNGFQCMVNLGLLPGIDGDYTRRSVALTYNDCGNFRDDWVHLAVDPDSPCVFTRDIARLELPVRHGEGKFFAAVDIYNRMAADRQIVLRYARPDGRPAGGAFPFNPNGSIHDIAGICDSTGRVFGLMPHPEAYNHWTNHPDWTRLKEKIRRGQSELPAPETLGVQIFKNAVDYFA
jgi:phosphoribosylformylglycinamidine synthase subunit PurQ / glutaminase